MRAVDTNVLVGERDAVLAATARVAKGWDFADALHHALSAGCDEFATLDANLGKRAGREAAVKPQVMKV